MKFVRTGKHRPEALDRIIEIDTLKEARWRLKRMDYLLGFIKERMPKVFPRYLVNLSIKYQDLLDEERKSTNPFDIDDFLSDNQNIGNSNIIWMVTSYLLQILQLPADASPGKHNVVNRNYFRSFSHISYPNLLVLTETIGREEAIALYKRFVTQYYTDERNPNRMMYDNLETLYEKHIQPQENPSDWVIVRGMIADGKYAWRNDNCLFLESQNDLPDAELKYYISCYGDFERAKDFHDSVILTMEHTIAQGDPYCSRIYHDTRVDWDLKHLPKIFWDSMEPENQ